MSKLPPPPIAISLIACERLIQDTNSGQMSLVAIVSFVESAGFPVVLPSLSFYAELTNGRGSVPVKILVVDANETREPVVELDMDVAFTDPLEVTSIGLTAPGLTFSDPGEYLIQLHASGEVLLTRRLVVTLEAGSEPVE